MRKMSSSYVVGILLIQDMFPFFPHYANFKYNKRDGGDVLYVLMNCYYFINTFL